MDSRSIDSVPYPRDGLLDPRHARRTTQFTFFREGPVESTDKTPSRIRVELTTEQKQQIKDASGEEVSVLEFTAQELEERIAPRSVK
jgi:hypothetical protein